MMEGANIPTANLVLVTQCCTDEVFSFAQSSNYRENPG